MREEERESITRELREQRLKQRGCTIWLTGLNGAGKSSIAFDLEKKLFTHGILSFVLDADRMNSGLCRDLGYSPVDHSENIRRCAEVAKLFATAGLVTIVSFIAPYQADRKWARELHDNLKIPFFECFVDAPMAVCKRRDLPRIHKMALKGEIAQASAGEVLYEKPEKPDLHLRTDSTSAEACAQSIYELLIRSRLLPQKN